MQTTLRTTLNRAGQAALAEPKQRTRARLLSLGKRPLIHAAALGILAIGLGSFLAVAAAPASPQSLITGKAYLNIGGVNVTDLTGNAKFPSKPDVVVYLPYFEWNPSGDINTAANNAYGENYGVQMAGYFYPPVTGDYIFWVCADDGAALYLSTDDNPVNKKLIAQEQGWSNPRQWDTANGGPPEVKNSSTFTGTQWPSKSSSGGAKITLQANTPYYIEGLMKEAGGGDNLAVAVAAPNSSIDQTLPIPGKYLAPFGVSAAPTIIAQPQDAAVYAGGLATFFVGLDIPPSATLASIKWTKNGVDIPNSNAATVNVTAALSDNGAKIKAIVTTSTGTLNSAEATLNVASFTSEFAPGVVKFEAFTGINGTAVQGLLDAQSFIDNKPNDVRLVVGIDSPNAYGDNYGARLSGFVIPPESGQYRFFIRSDDASQFFLSANETPPNITAVLPICEETGCCNAFTEPDSTRTSEPMALVAGKKYAFIALVKEGSGGDYLQVAARKEGSATAASALLPLSGAWVGANAKPNLGDPQITKQPQALPKVIEGTTARLSVDGVVTPTAYNFPIMVQWQKNGQPIAGATARDLVLSNAKAADSGTYRAVVSAPSGKSVNSGDAVVTVVPDTFPPVPTAGAIPSTTAGTIDIGIGFDEPVDSVSAGVAANYSVTPGTVASVQFYAKSQSTLLKVTGLTAGASTTVTIKNVADLKGNKITTATVPVTISSKLKWGVVGAAELGKGNWVVPVSGNGFDVYSDSIAEWGTYDEATFVYEEVTGDFDKVLRVEYQDNSSQWARAGLIVRETLNLGVDRATQGAGEAGRYQKCHVNPVGPTLTGPGNAGNGAWETNRRLEKGGATSASGGGGAPVPYPNAWCRIKRTGSTFEMFRSSDGAAWISLGSTTFDPAMPATLYVGPEFAPENGNITNEAERGTWLAKIRDYGDFSTAVPGTPTKVNYERTATGVKVTFTGTLQSADAVTGPWTDVAGASSPAEVPFTGTGKFYRSKK